MNGKLNTNDYVYKMTAQKFLNIIVQKSISRSNYIKICIYFRYAYN